MTRSPLSGWLRNGNRNLQHTIADRQSNFQACSFNHSDISPVKNQRVASGLEKDSAKPSFTHTGAYNLSGRPFVGRSVCWERNIVRSMKASLEAHAESVVRSRNGYWLLAETSSQPGYERARGLYRKQGYVALVQIPDYYKPSDDLVIFGKRL